MPSRLTKSGQSKTFLVDEVPVRRTLIALARRLDQICIAAATKVWGVVGLTALHGGILAYLNKVDGEPDIDQNTLAARMGIDRATTSQLVCELEAMGLLERRINGADRRGRLLRLTAHGEKVRAQKHIASSAAYEDLLHPLTPREMEMMLNFMVRVVEANSELARPGAGRRKRGYRELKTSDKSKQSPSRES